MGAPTAPPAEGRVVPRKLGRLLPPAVVVLLAAAVVGLVAWTVAERWDGRSATQPPGERPAVIGARLEQEPWDVIAFTRADGIYVMRSDGTGLRALRRGGVAAEARDLSWSPDGRRLAFANGRAIWVMNWDGSGLARIADRRPCRPAPRVFCSGVEAPTWSPDGRRVAFARGDVDAEGARFDPGLWVVNADGSDERLLLRTRATEGMPHMLDWSPDGRRIAFVTGGYLPKVYVVGANGRDLRTVTPGTHAFGVDPDWSPDGRWIAFRRWPGGGVGELYLSAPDGRPQVRLTRTAGTDLRDREPSWSPDGARIVFVRTHWRQGPRSAELYVMDVDGSGLRRLTANGVAEESPAWRPRPMSERALGGRRVGDSAPGLIAFARADGIYAMRADGSRIRALRRGGPAAAAGALAWSPDGRRLAFLSGFPWQQSLWVMDADGRHLVRLAAATSAAGDFLGPPAWSPDGTLLAYTAKRAATIADVPTTPVDREVWVVNADGSERRVLRRTPKQWEVEVDWRPAGGHILYTDLTGYTSRIKVVRTSGLDERLLTWEWDFQAIDPHWAPDGSAILFMHPTTRNSIKAESEELYLLDPDNAERRRLTTNDVSDRDPRWSPDGSKIVFVRGHEEPLCMVCLPLPQRGRSEIYVMNADGTGAVRLTHNRLSEADPAWQPVPR